jgi:hypothetical protein
MEDWGDVNTSRTIRDPNRVLIDRRRDRAIFDAAAIKVVH